MLCSVILTYCIFLLDESTVRRLTREDGLIETLGAGGFLGSSLLFFLTYILSRAKRPSISALRSRRRNLLYLGLSVLFMFGFLEEISWGQRLLHMQTPELLAEGNRQNEINLHNLRVFHGTDDRGDRKSFWGLLLNMDRLFSVFWLSLCVCVPLLFRYVRKARTLLERLRIPIVPTGFAGLFLANYAISRGVAGWDLAYRHNVVEVKESIFALLFVCAAAALLYREIKTRNAAANPARERT
jgi:hypothetical protein